MKFSWKNIAFGPVACLMISRGEANRSEIMTAPENGRYVEWSNDGGLVAFKIFDENGVSVYEDHTGASAYHNFGEQWQNQNRILFSSSDVGDSSYSLIGGERRRRDAGRFPQWPSGRYVLSLILCDGKHIFKSAKPVAAIHRVLFQR